MRILFAGTPVSATVVLEALLHSEHEIAGVLTRAPAPVGRRRVLRESPVHDYARSHGIPVYTPATLKNNADFAADLKKMNVDLTVVVAYGMLIPADLLQIPAHGWFNLHYSLLPRWRGASPVQATIAAGDDTCGFTVFQIDAGLDTGRVLCRESFPRDPNLTADELISFLSLRGARRIVSELDAFPSGGYVLHPQEGDPSYAGKLSSAAARINWNLPAREVQNLIHANTAHPGAWTVLEGQRIKIGKVKISVSASDLKPGEICFSGGNVEVGTHTENIILSAVIPAGKTRMDASAWYRGVQNHSGCRIFETEPEREKDSHV